MQRILNDAEQLVEVLKQHGSKNILLVTSPRSYELSGADKIPLPAHNVIRFKATPNPNMHDIEKVVQLCHRHAVDTFVAIGGGSAIDTAKAARMLAGVEVPVAEVVKNSLTLKDPTTFFVAVPTTAGSGAEATQFAVVYIDQQKYSLSHPKALANVVVLDPRLTHSLPPHITATSGMDAVAQAIEAYWSVKSTEESRDYSQQALEKLLPNLKQAVHLPTPSVRQAMLEGAHLAGQAINIAQTTGPHALSYGFTSQHGIDHGEAVNLTLPHFLVFNSLLTDDNCNDARGVAFVKNRIDDVVKLLGAATVDDAAERLTTLAESIGLSRATHVDDLDALVAAVGMDRLKNNPRLVTSKDVRSILAQVTAG